MAQPLLSVVMPCYNEVLTITEILRRVDAVAVDKEVIVVDDGSTDGTRDVLTTIGSSWKAADHPHTTLRILLQPHNMGKGAAVRTGIAAATGRITIIQDADLEYDPQDYHRVIQPILDGSADVVYGSRFDGTPRRVLFFWHAIGNWALTTLSNMLTDLNLTDMETCYKAFRTEIIQAIPLEQDRFGIEPEITAKVARLGLRIYEVPVSYYGRTYAEGKKIGWRDGVQAAQVMWRYSRGGAIDRSGLGQRAIANEQRLGSYNQWLLRVLKPHLGRRVLEVGANIGHLSRKLLDRERLVATDGDPARVEELKTLLRDVPHARVSRWDVTEPAPKALRAERPDTILACNLLQCVDDDDAALRHFADLLPDGGRLVLVVPSGQRAHGSLDETLGWKRRYDRAELQRRLEAAGFEVDELRPINALALPAWFVSSRLLKRDHIGRAQVRMMNLGAPLLAWEQRLQPPFGLSLLAVATRRAA